MFSDMALDINRENYEIRHPVIEKAGVAHKIHFREGPPIPIFDQIIANVSSGRITSNSVETLLTMSPENKAHYESEKEAIHLLLTGIGDEIYSTVDPCKTAHEMWIAIKRLQQGESLNIQDVKTNMFWEFGKFTSHDGESMESYYSRFYKMMNEMIRNNLTVATM
ncbi:ribulose-1,5-bisphosphate carboxylase/oxygenase large subunit, chloroplastic [Tanacetum coccineum]